MISVQMVYIDIVDYAAKNNSFICLEKFVNICIFSELLWSISVFFLPNQLNDQR